MSSTLLERAERALGGQPVEEAVGKVRAIIGLPSVPDSERSAQAALDKLHAGEAPTAMELAALELVVRMMRPAPLSRAGDLDALPSAPGSSTYNPETVALWEHFRAVVKPFLYSIGRLDRTTGANRETGTGFLVADDLLVTNRHVLGQLSYGAEVIEEGQAVVRFNQEFGSPEPAEAAFAIVGVVGVHPTLDMALLRVALPQPRPVPTLDGTPIAARAEVAAIGYPWRDPTSPLFAQAIFGNHYGVKRAAIGEILDAGPERLFHDCSTLGGNSGSPLFSLASGSVVGLHYSGLFMYRNEGIPAAEVVRFVDRADG